jgi:hypothetical protein
LPGSGRVFLSPTSRGLVGSGSTLRQSESHTSRRGHAGGRHARSRRLPRLTLIEIRTCGAAASHTSHHSCRVALDPRTSHLLAGCNARFCQGPDPPSTERYGPFPLQPAVIGTVPCTCPRQERRHPSARVATADARVILSETKRCSSMPASIARRNTHACHTPKASAAMAGPGHTPTRPHPTPKSAEPSTRGASSVRASGI